METDKKNIEYINKAFTSLLGDRYSTAESTRTNHARGEDIFDPILPVGVAYPKSTEEVSEIVKICNKNKIPIVPFGMGSSLEGHVLGIQTGITVSLEKMNNIISTNSEDFDCKVEAYVTREQLDEHLRDQGLFFPIDPGAEATLGGMTATSASGTMAVKYGTMKSMVLGLTVVLPNGDIIHTGGRTKKTAAGYNLTNLFVGSEGTLGIITEIQLRLVPIPENIISAICQFDNLESAVATAQEIIQYGIPVARIELLNSDQMDITIKYSKLEGLEPKPTLFYEFHGSENANNDAVELVEEISNNNKGSQFKWAKSKEERIKLWKARHEAYYSVKALEPNARVYTTDACVPISKLAECIGFAENKIKEYGLLAPIIGHVGDGNFHCFLLYNPELKKTHNLIREFSNILITKTLELEGTISGEHGIGINKKEYLVMQHKDNISLMQTIKRIIDPNNIMNPGKVIDV
jgi:D-lactate dehydrogenase (cytochrome)